MIWGIFSCELPKNKQLPCGSLSEYQAGYWAFSKELLEKLPLDQNSEDFVFDNQMLAQIDTDGIHALYNHSPRYNDTDDFCHHLLRNYLINVLDSILDRCYQKLSVEDIVPLEPLINNQKQSDFGFDAACVYCHRVNSRPLYDTVSTAGDRFSLNKCRYCNCCFLSPNPTNQQLDAAYDDSYYGQSESKFPGWIEKVLDHFRSKRARKVMRYVKAPANVLDIGCGNGRFLQGLIGKNFNCYGIELPSKSAERASRIPGLNLKTGQLCENDFESHFFDVVTMWHVIEHLPEPLETLQIMGKILKQGGYLLVSLPNIDSFQSRLFSGSWLHLDPPRHLFFFGAVDLTKIMQTLGFEIVTIKYFSLEQNPFGMQQSILNCMLRKREVLFEVLKGNRLYACEYSGLSILFQKIFYIMTFPLFAMLSVIEACLKKGGTMEMVFRKVRR